MMQAGRHIASIGTVIEELGTGKTQIAHLYQELKEREPQEQLGICKLLPVTPLIAAKGLISTLAQSGTEETLFRPTMQHAFHQALTKLHEERVRLLVVDECEALTAIEKREK